MAASIQMIFLFLLLTKDPRLLNSSQRRNWKPLRLLALPQSRSLAMQSPRSSSLSESSRLMCLRRGLRRNSTDITLTPSRSPKMEKVQNSQLILLLEALEEWANSLMNARIDAAFALQMPKYSTQAADKTLKTTIIWHLLGETLLLQAAREAQILTMACLVREMYQQPLNLPPLRHLRTQSLIVLSSSEAQAWLNLRVV